MSTTSSFLCYLYLLLSPSECCSDSGRLTTRERLWRKCVTRFSFLLRPTIISQLDISEILICLFFFFFPLAILHQFEIALVAVLKDFNTQDIPAHSIKWAFRKRDSRLRLGPSYRILLIQADVEAEVDTLPAYEGTHQDIVVLMSPEDEMEGRDDRLPSSSSTSALPHYDQTLQMRLIQSSPRPSATMSEAARTISAAVSVELDREPTMVVSNQASPPATESPVTIETVDSVSELGMRMIERPPPLVVREEPPGYDVVISTRDTS